VDGRQADTQNGGVFESVKVKGNTSLDDAPITRHNGSNPEPQLQSQAGALPAPATDTREPGTFRKNADASSGFEQLAGAATQSSAREETA